MVAQISMWSQVSYIQSHGHWLLFDDDLVAVVEEKDVQNVSGIAFLSVFDNHGSFVQVFGTTKQNAGVTQTGYILFYQQHSGA